VKIIGTIKITNKTCELPVFTNYFDEFLYYKKLSLITIYKKKPDAQAPGLRYPMKNPTGTGTTYNTLPIQQ